MKKYLVSFLILLAFCLSGISQTTAATSSGSWSGGIWDNGTPACGSHDVLIIKRGITVDIKNSTIDLSSCDVMIIIEDDATLELERTGNGGNEALLKLSAISSIKFEGTGQIEAVSNKPAKLNTVVVEIGGYEIWNGSQTSQVLSGPGFANANTSNGNLASPLPVEMVTFEAFAEENEVVLKWITESEVNNDFFEIQRSKDGKAIP